MRLTATHYASLHWTAIVSFLFSLVVGTILGIDFSRRNVDLAVDVPQWMELKTQLAEQPDNIALKETLREIDLHLREDYFRHRRFVLRGSILLVGGIAVMLVTARLASTVRRKLPMPPVDAPQVDHDARLATLGRWGVGGMALFLVGAALALWSSIPSRLPATVEALLEVAGTAPAGTAAEPAPQPSPIVPAEARPPTPEALAQNWPRFRGPAGAGISASATAPTTWDASTGKNIVWKKPVPLPGNNSPVIWQDRLFVTGATESLRVVYCFDTKSGDVIWQREMPAPISEAPPPEVSEETGFAAPTAATDGRRVYVTFATGDVAALDFDGNLVWQVPLGTPKNIYGFATSLTTFRDFLIVQFDQGTAKDDLSSLIALDSASGKIAWRTARKVPNSWPSPIVIEHDGKPRIITAADPWVIAYDPESGAEVWRAKCLRQDVGPSPVYADGVVFVANEFPALSAIRAGGMGDVTETHIRWAAEDGLPDTCGPLVVGPLVLVLASYGTLTCYDGGEGGDPLWEMDFDDNFRSSPSLVGENVYLFGEEGRSWVLQVDREGGQILAEGNLAEPCVTSPAILNGQIFVRGKEHLFCIGND